jgi:hypothetical protein
MSEFLGGVVTGATLVTIVGWFFDLFSDDIKARVVGWAVKPNLTVSRVLTAEVPNDSRPLIRYWWVLHCRNEPRQQGFIGRLFTAVAYDCEAVLSVTRIGEERPCLKDQGVWIGPKATGRLRTRITADGEPVGLSLFVAVDHPEPDFRAPRLVPTGTYLAGQRFSDFGMLESERLPPGHYYLHATITTASGQSIPFEHTIEVSE